MEEKEYKIGQEFFDKNMTKKIVYSNLENSLTPNGNKELAVEDAFILGLYKIGSELIKTYFPDITKNIQNQLGNFLEDLSTLEVLKMTIKDNNQDSKLSIFYYN